VRGSAAGDVGIVVVYVDVVGVSAIVIVSGECLLGSRPGSPHPETAEHPGGDMTFFSFSKTTYCTYSSWRDALLECVTHLFFFAFASCVSALRSFFLFFFPPFYEENTQVQSVAIV